MCQLGNSSREIMGGLQHLANPGTLIQRHCHAHYGPAWLTAGSRGRSRHWPVRMSRRGDCPLVELEYMVLSSVKHTPTFDVTANSRRESLLATSALNPVTLTALSSWCIACALRTDCPQQFQLSSFLLSHGCCRLSRG